MWDCVQGKNTNIKVMALSDGDFSLVLHVVV